MGYQRNKAIPTGRINSMTFLKSNKLIFFITETVGNRAKLGTEIWVYAAFKITEQIFFQCGYPYWTLTYRTVLFCRSSWPAPPDTLRVANYQEDPEAFPLFSPQCCRARASTPGSRGGW